MTYLLTIDPGRITGWAYFEVETKKLHACGRHSGSPKELVRAKVSQAVIEKPVIYRYGSKADPDDILRLMGVAAQWKQFLEERGASVRYSEPREWKRSVPKDIHNRRTLASLTAEELVVVPLRPRAGDYDHNTLDAIGLGLWVLGRTQRP